MKKTVAIARLEKKLLALGGSKADIPADTDLAAALVLRGRPFAEPLRLRRGFMHECHRNAAEVWGQDPRRYKLCSGYGLAGDVWLEHSWVLDGGNLIETTFPMEAYFGVILSDAESCASWFYNFLQWRFPGPTAFLVPSFLKCPRAR
jgi:hypothetical protein